jgi:hypothetical protein
LTKKCNIGTINLIKNIGKVLDAVLKNASGDDLHVVEVKRKPWFLS